MCEDYLVVGSAPRLGVLVLLILISVGNCCLLVRVIRVSVTLSHGYVRTFESAPHDTGSIGFHVLICGTLGACFALRPPDWLLPCKVEVWQWVVKRRIFDPFSEYSGWILLHLMFRELCIYGPSGWASVTVSPFPHCGVMIYISCPLYS